MIKIAEKDIKKIVLVCPYCMNDVAPEQFGCCGESSAHFEHAVVTNDDDCFLLIEVIYDKNNENDN